MVLSRQLGLLGSGIFLSLVVVRWIADRDRIRLHRILGDNFWLLDETEIETARMLLATGHAHLLRGWPAKGVHDAAKHTFLRSTSQRINSAYAAAGNDRIPVLKAPVCVQKPHNVTEHGDSRYDPFYWLRSDSRDAPEVLAYLKAENTYCAEALADTQDLQKQLYKEMRSRIQEADTSAPVPRNGYFYYRRTLEGKQYAVHCRRPIGDVEGPVDETIEIDQSIREEVLLDENAEARKHEYYDVHDVSVTDDGCVVAFSEDTVGSELYSVRVVDTATRKPLLQEGPTKTTGQVEWAADNSTFFYVAQDEKQRPFQVYRHSLEAGAKPECIFQEDDEKFYVTLSKSADKKLILIHAAASMQNEIRFLLSDNPKGEFQVALPRSADVDYGVEHWHDHVFMTMRTTDTPNSRLLIAPLSDLTQQRELRPHRDDTQLEDVSVSEKHIALLERVNGLSECHVFTLPDPAEAETLELEGGEKLAFDDPTYVLAFSAQPDFESDVLNLFYSSLAKPSTWFAHNMATGARVTKHMAPVLGGFEQDSYVTNRLWAASHDGVKVPISLVYNKHIVQPNSGAPLLLDAYGAYGVINAPRFSRERLSLLDRGIVFAIAHVRGGGEMGRRWYENGKFLEKPNTFKDVIAAAEHLIAEDWTLPGRLVLEGRSAGGMTVGTVANMRPDLFHAIVAGVPFVDCLTTMLDDSIPLTTIEYEEWGNPHEKQFYDCMKSYSPVDNVQRQRYPHIYVTSGLHDPRVGYWEPSKWVAKLRLNKTDENMLLFKCDMGAGHFSQTGRFDILKEDAMDTAFILKVLGLMHEEPVTSQ
eukprot:jgi/Ulvmu1/8977/UM005_0068.1